MRIQSVASEFSGMIAYKDGKVCPFRGTYDSKQVSQLECSDVVKALKFQKVLASINDALGNIDIKIGDVQTDPLIDDVIISFRGQVAYDDNTNASFVLIYSAGMANFIGSREALVDMLNDPAFAGPMNQILQSVTETTNIEIGFDPVGY